MEEEKSYDIYRKVKTGEFKDIINQHIAELEEPERIPRGTLGRVEVEIRPVRPTRQATLKRETEFFGLDIFLIAFAVITFAIPFFRPDWQIAYAFTAVLLFSAFTRSILLRVAAITLTFLYLLFGVYVDLSSVLLIVFGVNTITTGPLVITILMTTLIGGAGVIHGLTRSTRHSGIWIISLTLLMAALDAILGYYTHLNSDWVMLFSVHTVIYLTAFTITWALFYLLCRFMRWAVSAASKERW